MNKRLNIVKLGGDVVDDAQRRATVFEALQSLQGSLLLVHGGGKVATQLSEELGIATTMVEGRRITDEATLRVVVMSYAGLINKQLVAELQSRGVPALGLSGADADVIRAHKRQHPSIDFGFVGDIDAVNTKVLSALLEQQLVPVVAPITHDGKGQLLNTNADTIATRLALALKDMYTVQLFMLMDKAGVLRNVDDDSSVLTRLSVMDYAQMRKNGSVSAGMIAKLDNAFQLVDAGVSVRLCSWRALSGGTVLR